MDEKFICHFCSKPLPTSQGLKSHITRLHKSQDYYPSHNPSERLAAPRSVHRTAQTRPLETVTVPKQICSPEVYPREDLERTVVESIEACLTRRRLALRVMKRVPRGARFSVAEALASTLDRCVSENTDLAWRQLFLFATACLGLPAHRSDRQVSLTTLVKSQVVSFLKCNSDDGNAHVKETPAPNNHRDNKHSIDSARARRIESKVAEGDVRGAVRIMCSEEVFADNRKSTAEALRKKHPSGSQHQDFPSPTGPGHQDYRPLKASVSLVKKALLSFPLGSAGGLDGLNPQHLKDLTTTSAGSAGERLIVALTNLSNFMLAGFVTPEVLPTLFGASMCALEKKSGGIRPIAIGNVLRRLVAKVGCNHIKAKIGGLLRPVQLGFGTNGGAEAAAHAARRYLSTRDGQRRIFLKVDFLNAFNMLRRDHLLCMVKTEMPELFPFLYQCYRFPSTLVYEGEIISSERGLQQGDPLAPALFCMSTRPVSSLMKAELNLWYLDDVTLAGSADVVLEDLLTLKEKAAEWGLEVNPRKCEMFVTQEGQAESNEVVTAFEEVLPGLKCLSKKECILLGVPIMPEATEACIDSRTKDLQRLAERLRYVSAHCGYFLLKNSLAIPRLNYLLRCSLAWLYPDSLKEFDAVLRSALESVTNCLLEDHSWKQSALPVSMGGLGIRHAAQLALPAFLASTCSVANLVNAILPEGIAEVDDMYIEGVKRWTECSSSTPGSREAQSLQHHWEDPITHLEASRLLNEATSLKERARLLGVKSREASAWLNAIPSAPIGTFMENDSFRIAIALRLGSPICRPHTCPCGSFVDESGTHGLSCKRSAGRQSRHGAINDIIKRALVSAGIPAVLEPSGLARDDGKRPDGMTLIPWSRGRSLVWDATCVDTLAASHVESTSVVQGSAAGSAEVKKCNKYSNLVNRFLFRPISVETLGAFGLTTLPFIRELGRRISEATGEIRSTSYLMQRLGIAIQKGNAASIMNTVPAGESMADFISLL